MKRICGLLLIALGAVLLAGCGLRGDLDRPPPLWGDPAQAETAESEAPREETTA